MSKKILDALTSYDFEKSVNKKLDGLDKENSPVSDEEYSQFADATVSEDIEEISDVMDAFSTGKFQGGSKKIKDVMMSMDFPELFGAATEILMMSRIMPARVISENLFQTIPYSGQSSNITIRTLGGVNIEEVPEGSLYPETGTSVADIAYRINLEIKKYGAKVAGTKELIESDNWGIFAATIAMLGDELLMNKEKMCARLINDRAGYVLIDNANASSVELGSATGRDIAGAFNGALGLDDIMNLMAWMEMRGYYIDTVLMHPFAWNMWQRDPEIREVMLGTSVTHVPSGNAAPGWGDPFGGMGYNFGKFGSSITTADPADITGLSSYNTAEPLAGKLGISQFGYPNLTPFGSTYMAQPRHTDRPLKVIVTPLVPYYKVATGTRAGKFATNLIFADSTKAGLILQKENPSMHEWEDIEREINFVKVREKYGIALKEQGRGIAIAKNIVIDRTYAFDNVNSVSLTATDTGENRI